MPSKKKTRKQKLLSDNRRVQSEKTVSTTYSFSDIQPENNVTSAKKPASTHAITTQSYQYLSHDLLRTLVVTVVIIAVQLILHVFVLK